MAKDLDAIKATFRSGDYVAFPLKDVMIAWAGHLSTPDTKFDPEGKYKCDAIIGDDMAEEMTEVGFNVKKNADGQFYVRPTRKPELGAPIIVDKTGAPIDPKIIGNGTIATIDVKTKFMVVGGAERMPIYIEKITISDLVKYEGSLTTSVDPF